MVLALTPRQWRALVDATGLAAEIGAIEAAGGVNLKRESDRWRCRAEIARVLETWIGARTQSQVRSAFDEHGVLWGPYQTFKELVELDPRASTANPLLAEVEHAGAGRYLTPGSPLRFGRTPAAAPRGAPALGQHNAEVFGELRAADR